MTERLYFAWWPDATLRDELARRSPAWLAGSSGHPARPDQWHVTLEFIGAVTTERRAVLERAADGLAVPELEVQFDRVEHWRKPQVACLVATQVPASVARWVGQLRDAVAAAGFEPDRRTFRPHVTLARKVRLAVERAVDPPLCWRARGFALVRSTSEPTGSRYEPVRWWNACAGGG